MTSRASIIWDPAFLGYDLGGQHPLDPIRLDLTMRLAGSLGVLDGVSTVVPAGATDEELCTAHDRAYLAAVKAAPDAPGYAGYGLGTADNPVFERMHEASALIAGGSLAAADEIASGRTARAVNIAGGLHHAMHSQAAGFCVYNDCVLAIRRLLEAGLCRIAYVDIDVHHGDGVQAAFVDDPRVLTISLHQDPRTLFPGTGRAADVGAPGAEGFAVNVALPPGIRDAEWLRAFHAVVPGLLRTFEPEVLVTQHGADSHAEDPLADMALSIEGQRSAHLALRALSEQTASGRWLALGGGGYSLFRVVPRSWTHLLATILDRDLDPNTPVPASWTTHTAGLAPDVRLPTSMGDGVDGGEPMWSAWDGFGQSGVDRAIEETRCSVYPLHGLDPYDSRD